MKPASVWCPSVRVANRDFVVHSQLLVCRGIIWTHVPVFSRAMLARLIHILTNKPPRFAPH